MPISNLLYSEEQGFFHIAPVTDLEGQESNGYKFLVEFKDDKELTLLTRFIRLEYPSINVDKENVPSFKDVLDCTNYILENLNSQKIKLFYQLVSNDDGSCGIRWFLTDAKREVWLDQQDAQMDDSEGSVETFVGSDIYLKALQLDNEYF
jgi:hypothetical protein